MSNPTLSDLVLCTTFTSREVTHFYFSQHVTLNHRKNTYKQVKVNSMFAGLILADIMNLIKTVSKQYQLSAWKRFVSLVFSYLWFFFES